MSINTQALKTLEQVRAFLDGTLAVQFQAVTRAERHRFLESVLRRFDYPRLGRADRGLILRFLSKMTGYSRQQTTRLVAQWRADGRLADRRGPPAQPFARRYTEADVRLLAEMDQLHGTLSGPATKKLAQRAVTLFGQTEYARLAGISVAHLYNLRQSKAYRRQRGEVHKTRPTSTPIGVRRPPAPNGRPGFIRVDTVHQGDWDGVKGVYVINAVDEVT